MNYYFLPVDSTDRLSFLVKKKKKKQIFLFFFLLIFCFFFCSTKRGMNPRKLTMILDQVVLLTLSRSFAKTITMQ